MSLNFVLPKNSRWILGGLDITSLVVDFSVRHPIAEITTPLIWKGTLNIAQQEGEPFEESLSELENPSRWERCQQPLEVYFGDIKFLTLEIDSYFYDEDTGRGTAEITDKLGLLDWRSPADEIEGVKIGKDNDWWDVVKLALLQAGRNPDSGAEYLSESDIDFDSSYSPAGTYSVPLVKMSGSYIKFAQEVAGAHGHWLWCDRDGKIRLAKYPTNPKSAIASLSRSEVAKYEREQSPERPYERIIVTGAKDELADCGSTDDGETIVGYGYINNNHVLIREEVISPVKKSKNKDTIYRSVRRALGDILPNNKKYKNSTEMILESTEVEERDYDKENRLIKVTINRQKALCSMFPNSFPDNFSLKGQEMDTEEYFFTSKGAIKAAFDLTSRLANKQISDQGEKKCKKEKVDTENDDNVIKQKIVTNRSSFVVTKDVISPKPELTSLLIRQEVNETWFQKKSGRSTKAAGGTKKSAQCDRWKYRRTVKRRDTIKSYDLFDVKYSETDTPTGFKETILTTKPGELRLVELVTQEDSRPPSPTYREAENPVGTVTFCGEESFDLPYDACTEKTQEYNINWLTNQKNAQMVAHLIGKMQWHRRYSRHISHPIYYPWFLENWEPFITVNIKDGHYICDGLVISCVRSSVNEAEFAWTGNYVGKIDKPIQSPKTKLIQYPAPKCNLVQIARTNTGNASINYSGVYPLPSDAIAIGLPLGMSVKNGFIVGTPSNPGIYTGSIQIKNIVYPIDIFTSPSRSLITNYQPVGTRYQFVPNSTLTAIPSNATISGLPSGITYDSETGSFQGSPTNTGSYPITVTVNGTTHDFTLNATQNTATYQPNSYLIDAPIGVFFDPTTGTVTGDTGATASFKVATQNSDGTITYSQVQPVNATPVFTQSATVVGLPSNIQFDPVTESLTGNVVPGQNYSFTVQESTPTGIVSSTYSIVASPVPPPAPPSIQNIVIAQGATLNNFYIPGSQAIAGLPPGITFSQQGYIQGVPTTPGNYAVTATILQSGTQYSIPFQILVESPPSVNPYIKTPLFHNVEIEVLILQSESSLVFADLSHNQSIEVGITMTIQEAQNTALNFGLIVVDKYGNVLTSGGYVVTQSVTNEFDVIVVDKYGKIVTSNGYVVTTTGDIRYNAIVVNKYGDVVTENGNVVFAP